MNSIIGKIKDYICEAWKTSRLIFINVVGFFTVAGNEIIGFLLSVDYDAFFRHEVSVLIMLAVNVLSIIYHIDDKKSDDEEEEDDE